MLGAAMKVRGRLGEYNTGNGVAPTQLYIYLCFLSNTKTIDWYAMDTRKDTPRKHSYFRGFGIRLLHEIRQRYSLIFALLVAALILNELYLFGTNFSDWDPLLISGALTFMIGIRLALNIPQIVAETLSRLVNRGSLNLDPNQLAEFKQKLEEQTTSYGQRGGLIISTAILLAFIIVFRLQRQIPLTILESLGGYVAGQFLGWAISYGRLGNLLREQGISIQAQPGHLDGAAGLKPVGDLYFLQAMIIAIPAAYLAVWWLIIPLWPRYMGWREPYIGLLAIILVIEFLAFLLPIWSFHTEMQEQKSELLKDADGLSHDIVELQRKLVSTQSEQERSELKERLALMTAWYWEIEKMPTWPVDIRVQRKFTFGNLGLFLPLFSRFLNIKTETGLKLWEEIGKIFVSLFQ